MGTPDCKENTLNIEQFFFLKVYIFCLPQHLAFCAAILYRLEQWTFYMRLFMAIKLKMCSSPLPFLAILHLSFLLIKPLNLSLFSPLNPCRISQPNCQSAFI